jgi:hypothetical protein
VRSLAEPVRLEPRITNSGSGHRSANQLRFASCSVVTMMQCASSEGCGRVIQVAFHLVPFGLTLTFLLLQPVYDWFSFGSA